MLRLIIPGHPSKELWDEKNERFHYLPATKDTALQLEHSLVSLSKWESKWHKPFLSEDSKTIEETRDYIRCMTLTQNINPEVYMDLTDENVNQVEAYIDDPMTATWFSNTENKPGKKEVITSEIIYYWMISYGVPFECQKWHLNRLLTLIKVCSIKNAPPKKMSKKESAARNAKLNAQRRAALHSKG